MNISSNSVGEDLGTTYGNDPKAAVAAAKKTTMNKRKKDNAKKNKAEKKLREQNFNNRMITLPIRDRDLRTEAIDAPCKSTRVNATGFECILTLSFDSPAAWFSVSHQIMPRKRLRGVCH